MLLNEAWCTVYTTNITSSTLELHWSIDPPWLLVLTWGLAIVLIGYFDKIYITVYSLKDQNYYYSIKVVRPLYTVILSFKNLGIFQYVYAHVGCVCTVTQHTNITQ